ncbi:hypothetical protein Sjap_006727 [Stephania japonica]|uniref:BRCT domain-containing protein n=1 Tax=Stephania japonica TaxID=461633 RepID=A0AAP0K880_9MAGN
MGFSEEDEDGSDTTKEMNPDGGVEETDFSDDDGDEETQQIPDSPDVKSHDFELTVPLYDTVPIIDEETQKVEDLDCGGDVGVEDETLKVEDSDWEAELRTQLVLNESDGEATDGTEVLSDDEGGFEDETCRIVGDDDSVSLEDKKDSSVVNGKTENGVSMTDSSASNSQCPSSGSARRSFMSIRAASLRASGRAAASKMTASEALNGLDSIAHKSYSGNTMDEIIDTAVFDTQRTEVVESDDNSDKNRIVNQFSSKSHGIGGRLTARKLFTEDTSAGSVSLYKNENSSGGGEAEFRVCDPNLAGLSYVDSQEPGLLSQENAMNVVEKLLSNNDVELSHELNPQRTTKEKSPPISSVKGLKYVAQQANSKSPVNGVGMFDWNDAREDEGGGDFFSKNKEAFFGSNYRGKRSFPQPQKSRQLNFNSDANTPEKSKRKKAGLNLRQKMSRLTRSDSRIVLNNSKRDQKIANIFGTQTTNNLFDKLDEKRNPESSDDPLRENEVGNDVADVCDIGIGTQMAAEAMEALACGLPAYVNASDATNVCNGNAMKDAGSKDDFAQKRTSNSEGTSHLSKRRKRVHDDRKGVLAPSTSRKVLRSQTKDSHPTSTDVTTKKNAKVKVNENLNVVNGEVKSGRRSSKRIEGNRSVNVVNKPSAMGVDGAQASKDYKLFTPIASRTRNSSSRKPSKRILSLFDDSGDRTNELVEVSMLVSSIRGSKEVAAESSGQKSNETYDGHAKVDTSICEKTDLLLNHCKGRRTRRKFSGHLEPTANLDCPSTLAEGETVNEQSARRKKRSKLDAKSTSSCLDMKREKLLNDKSSMKQDMVETGLADATVDCSLVVVNSKVVPKNRVKNTTPDEKKCNAQSVSCIKGREESVRSESRREQIQLSGSACLTPVNCASRDNPVSPVCIGDDNQIQSCKKSLSKSSLLRELLNLDAHEKIRTPTLKEFRKRKDMVSARVLLSNHLDEDIIKQQKKILGRLGASVASSASEATHFVADNFVRTRNMLEAIAHGKPVVTHLWLESCGQASCFIDEKRYILRDVKKEKEMGFSMPVSLARACMSSLLQGKRVVITPNVKPSKDVVVRLVRAVQGQAVERIGRSLMKDEEVPDDLLVLSCEEDYAICVPFLEKGAMVYSSELLLNGIVIQKLEYARHRLFTNHVKRTRSTIWLKKDENFFPVTKCRS